MNTLMIAAGMAAGLYLRSGDRIVFYGDSITEQRQYTTMVEAFIATRYPKLDVRFFTRGWAGDTSWGGGGGLPEERARRDVDPLHPTVVFVMLGMNDGGYFPYDVKVTTAIREWYGKTLDALFERNPHARLTFARTSPWDEYAHSFASVGKPPEPWAGWKGYNDVLRQYGSVYRELTERKGGLYTDFNQPLSDVLVAAHAKNAELARAIIPDSIHPAPAGHLVMAAELLKAWGAEPVVSRVVVDGASGKVIETTGTKVDKVGGFTWEQADERLPFAYDLNDQAMVLAAEIYGFDDSLNQQTLSVQGLAAGRYGLSIDGKDVGRFDETELAKGVNLAKRDTPMRAQSAEVLELCRQKSELEFFAWRHIDRADLDLAEAKKAHGALQALSDALQRKIHHAAEPKSHRYSLKRIP